MNPVLQQLVRLPEPARLAVLADFSEQQLHELVYDWELWARPNQLVPPGDWSTWLILAGRGYGKTRTGAETVRKWMCGTTPMAAGSYRRVALIAETAADARDVVVEGESGLLAAHPKDFRPVYEPSKRRLTWPNGATGHIYNATEPDQLRGPQHDCLVAGTLVETARGQVPIEYVRVGDLVLVRSGEYAKVSYISKRWANEVGEVEFDGPNGRQKLVGTPEHPVYIPARGWTKLSELRAGDLLWPIEWSIGAKSMRSGNNRENLDITKGDLESLVQRSGGLNTSTVKPGKTTTAQSLRGTSSTMWTGTPVITTSPISSVFPPGSTCSFTGRKTPATKKGSDRPRENGLPGTSNAGYAEPLSSAEHLAEGGDLHAGPVLTESGNVNGTSSPNVECVAKPSSLGLATIAPSVVSTWVDEGSNYVYCLTVEGQPEYFANGVLVHNCFWGDELAKWTYARDVWDQLQFGLRLGKSPRGVVTTTPRPIPVLLEIIDDPTSVITKGSTMENRANLAKKFIDKIHRRYAGTRLGRQELEAEVLTDLPGALWVRTYFDPADGSKHRGRVMASNLPELARVVVAVDPSGTSGQSDDGDSIGIIVAGIDHNGHGYVLADRSVKEGPAGWGRAAVAAYEHYNADRIVGEANYGGAMVEAVIRSVNPNVSYKAVTASRGKVLRAEPVAALYEQGRVSHVTGADPRDEEGLGLAMLEDQLCLMGPGGYVGEGSPDRADALVWALTELMLTEPEGEGYRFEIVL